jgi:hypothetical protein
VELSEGEYAVAELDAVRTPALLIYAERVDGNIAATLRLLGRAERWRPHLKTAKLELDHGAAPCRGRGAGENAPPPSSWKQRASRASRTCCWLIPRSDRP